MKILFDKLKEQPLVGLALAVAGGLVLAHFATRSVDYFYENELSSNPISALVLVGATCVALFISYRYGRWLLSFTKRRWRPITALFVTLAAVYIVMAFREVKMQARLRVAHQAYADEYNRRFAQFVSDHVGATQEEFLRYESDPDGFYGYAKILKNMNEAGTLLNPHKDEMLVKILRQGANCSSKDNDIDKFYCKEVESQRRELAKETGVDEDTIILNFDSIKKHAEREGQQATRDPILERQISDPLFAAIPYEDEYVKKLGDVTNPSRELEKKLYDQIVMERLEHPITFDPSSATPISPMRP